MSVTVAIGSTVTVATTGNASVDRHFGRMTEFLIYEVDGQRVHSIERRSIPRYCHGNNGEAGDFDTALLSFHDQWIAKRE
ncbi:NifB/NifX family molybdenum-iron cluster-binding protein [Pannus brasiliensis CCIBt3594]|uniref:NifB/NifX family molybdenum-iron cluster-binding protein n=1 Tax=Pannus brasiliensis CCIBt3594 TaxID=1427578 RepID=A0AAW9QK99_9CHRO